MQKSTTKVLSPKGMTLYSYDTFSFSIEEFTGFDEFGTIFEKIQGKYLDIIKHPATKEHMFKEIEVVTRRQHHDGINDMFYTLVITYRNKPRNIELIFNESVHLPNFFATFR